MGSPGAEVARESRHLGKGLVWDRTLPTPSYVKKSNSSTGGLERRTCYYTQENLRPQVGFEVVLIPRQLFLLCSHPSPFPLRVPQKAALLVLSSSTSKHTVLFC